MPVRNRFDDYAGNRFGSGFVPYRNPVETYPALSLGRPFGKVSNPLPNNLPVGVLLATILPQFAMPNFLTVKAAAIFSNRSPSSVRRIIYPILEDNRHPDRHHIEPDVATAKSLRVKGENFAWKVSEEFLRRVMAEEGTKTNTESKPVSKNAPDQSAAMLEIFRKQLDIKDQQIAAQNEVIKGLSERVREGNILMGSLQQQLALTDGSGRGKPDVVAADKHPQTSKAEPDPRAEKKTHWLFRKIF
jgi:hypothetical protein